MGRPPLPIGSHGRITTVQQGDLWRSRAYVRDVDGRRREIVRTAARKTAAEDALKDAIKHRVAPSSEEIGPESTFEKVVQAWFEQEERLSINSRRTYQHAIDNLVEALGKVRMRELSVPGCDRALKGIRLAHGNGSAKTAKAVMSNALGFAVRNGALPANLARDTSRITRKPRKKPRGFTVDEADYALRWLYSNEWAQDHDLPELVDAMLATGLRIGEMCAIRQEVLVDGTLEVNATIVREPGVGLVLQPRPKTAAGWRVLVQAPQLVEIFEHRATRPRVFAPHGIVFGSPRGHLRDPSNTMGDLRRVFDSIDCEHCDGRGIVPAVDKRGRPVFTKQGAQKWVRCDKGPFSWVTSHTFRKTVATRLEEAGFTPREIADILGHEKPSMTQDVYMTRGVVSARMGIALARNPIAA